jgi:hypothetical protein
MISFMISVVPPKIDWTRLSYWSSQSRWSSGLKACIELDRLPPRQVRTMARDERVTLRRQLPGPHPPFEGTGEPSRA